VISKRIVFAKDEGLKQSHQEELYTMRPACRQAGYFTIVRKEGAEKAISLIYNIKF